MIYELEKVELYGISWLNYFTLGLILTTISLIAVFVFVYFDLKKKWGRRWYIKLLCYNISYSNYNISSSYNI